MRWSECSLLCHIICFLVYASHKHCSDLLCDLFYSEIRMSKCQNITFDKCSSNSWDFCFLQLIWYRLCHLVCRCSAAAYWCRQQTVRDLLQQQQQCVLAGNRRLSYSSGGLSSSGFPPLTHCFSSSTVFMLSLSAPAVSLLTRKVHRGWHVLCFYTSNLLPASDSPSLWHL